MLASLAVLTACLAFSQKPEQNALDDVIQQQNRQLEAERLAGRRAFGASAYYLSERLYWTSLLAVESLHDADKIGARARADALALDLSEARRVLSEAWTASSAPAATQALQKAETEARALALHAAATPALGLKNRALWIADSAAAVRKDLPASASDWAAARAQSNCYALERRVDSRASTTVFAPGALGAIGAIRFSWPGETATLSDLAMKGTDLAGKLSVQRGSELVWDKRLVLELDKPFTFDRGETRIALTEKRAGPDVCRLSRASAEALFDLPRD